MATGCTAYQDLIECPVCKEEFTEEFMKPQALPCDHVLCQDCIDRIKKGIRIRCPVCNTLHKVSQVRQDFRLRQFLDVLKEKERSKKNKQKGDDLGDEPYCQVCSLEDAHYWCKDCKKWLCSGCKRSHPNIPTCKNHTTEPLSSKLQEIKSKYQCEAKTIKTKIKKYTSAAKFIEGKIDESEMAQIEALTESNDIRIRCIDDINKYFDTIDDRIMAFIQDQISPLKQNRKSLLSKLRKLKIKWNELEQMIKEDARKLVVDGQAILDEAKKINEFYSGLNMQYDDISIQITPGSTWKPTKAALLKMTGGAKITLGARPKLPSQPKLSSIANKSFRLTKVVDLPNIPYVVRFIDNKLWVGIENRVEIFDLNLNPINQYSNTAWGCVNDVTRVDNDLAIACSNGLFYVDSDCQEITKIGRGSYTSGIHRNGVLYAYEYSSNSIEKYKYNCSWKRLTTISSPFAQGHTTLSISDTTVTICSNTEHKLHIMNHNGQMLYTYGIRGFLVAEGIFRTYLCQEDDDGALLVTDRWNNSIQVIEKLQVLEKRGVWTNIKMNPDVSGPIGAVYVDGVIYVAACQARKLYSYTAI